MVGHNITCTPQGSGGVRVLRGKQIAADHLFCGVNDSLSSALILGCASSAADGEGGG